MSRSTGMGEAIARKIDLNSLRKVMEVETSFCSPNTYRRQENMLEKMKALLQKKDMCVLATTSDNKPHCSLMAYAVDENCTEVYMVTHKTTRKYTNITENPFVSLLIDTREEPDRSKAQALTVEGVFHRTEDSYEKKCVMERIVSTHPHLKEFADQSDATVLRIKIASFLLLDGLTEVHFETV